MQTGKIYTFTEIFSPPEGFKDEAPYSCAIMEDEDGRRFPAFLSPHTHWEDVRVGCAAICNGEQKNGIPVYELVR